MDTYTLILFENVIEYDLMSRSTTFDIAYMRAHDHDDDLYLYIINILYCIYVYIF